ncbi:diphosphomevalonate decarboxylase-like isoform X2 [Paramacrobiotus metropolitanus]|uniref:diphosphomevalonate decarboxylase-like isoform X2 n=1 Tax=Paramacrobiotus metropolitanus TaxID=2943436 RepID=UPI002445760E|nr:diphosphomevalonate decarboxylase-like isoform X2 [Paramacrobiotus metropolitanus]
MRSSSQYCGGKKNEDLVIPLNDSISVTLDTEHLRARTIVSLDPTSDGVQFSLNGKEETPSKRFMKVIALCKSEALRQGSIRENDTTLGLRIVSDNNFPTAAGLASSAAGISCLASALKAVYDIQGDISGIVRQGSGSACRSVYGGFVRWHTGHAGDGSDSVAQQIRPASHWPELRVLILVVNDKKKDVSSTSGMKESVDTSDLLRYRADFIANARCEAMTAAITDRNFEKFAELTMRDSNQFHAICLDTYPPIMYLDDTSKAVINLIHAYNRKSGRILAAYSFDAGPNPFLFTLSENLQSLVELLRLQFPSANSSFLRGLTDFLLKSPENVEYGDILNPVSDSVQYIIVTKAGEGPKTSVNEVPMSPFC